MRQPLAVFVWAAAFAATGFAQTPVITEVLDAAENSATVAPGGLFIVKGANLSANGLVQAQSLPLGTMLGGVKVTFTRLNVQTPTDAYMFYTYNLEGRNQLSALLPSSVTPGDYNVTVTNGTAVSANFRTTVVPRKFRVYTQDQTGSGGAVVQNFISQSRLDVNRLTTGVRFGATHSPARPGQVIIIWGSGFGALVGVADNVAPGAQDFRSSATTTVIVGGVTINPDYAGRAPEFPGTDQINVTLPTNVPTGCSVSLQVSVAGQLSNPTTLAIAPQGSDACVSPTYSKDLLSRLDAAGTVTTGMFTLTSVGGSINFQGFPISGTLEAAVGQFSRFGGAQLATAESFNNPAGTCQIFRRTSSRSGLLLGTSGTNLDAGGSVTLSGPNVRATANTLLRGEDESYLLELATTPGLPINLTPIVSSGAYQLTGSGGADVGTFTANLTIAQRITVSPALPSTVNRGAGLTVSWSGGGASDVVNVIGYSGTPLGGSATDPVLDAGVFFCTAQASAGRLTVPPSVLNQLPATPANNPAAGVLLVVSNALPSPSNGLFTASLTAGGNIDAGFFLPTVGAFATTQFQ